MIGALLLSGALALAAAPTPAVAVGGPAEDPAYLPVYAAAALGTFAAEGVQPVLRRAKHAAAAMAALHDGQAAIAVSTMEQAIRGAWARAKPVRVLVAHTEAPGVLLLVSGRHRDRITRVEDLRGARVGIPGPGTAGHLALLTLLAAQRMTPLDLELVSLGGAALAARLATGDLGAAVMEEPWASRALAAGGSDLLLDLRGAEDTRRRLGGPFYHIVSVAPTADPGPLEPALVAFARALIRVQAWLATTAPEAVADRLPPELTGDRNRFVARLSTARDAYVADGEATEAGLASTFRVLRTGSPWPVTLKVTPRDLREPAFVTAARAALGRPPPAP